MYQTVGAVPMVNRGRTDDPGLARAAGFGRAETFADPQGLADGLDGFIAHPGPALAVLQVEPETSFLGTPPMPFEGPEMKYRFGRAMERRFGVTVFGPQGY